MNFSKSICWSSLGLSLLVTSVGCFKPTDSRTTKPTVQTRKTIGKTTQNVLALKAARQAGGGSRRPITISKVCVLIFSLSAGQCRLSRRYRSLSRVVVSGCRGSYLFLRHVDVYPDLGIHGAGPEVLSRRGILHIDQRQADTKGPAR